MKNSYLCPKSELRQFLDAHNITIDLSKHFLSYAGNKYDIEFGSCPKSNTKEFCCWSVGRKFYYDFSICGFLSIWDISPYGGLVHARPEVLMNLDKLLNLSLSREWANTHMVQERANWPKKIGRNDPCPCGSGKKYKFCHGKN